MPGLVDLICIAVPEVQARRNFFAVPRQAVEEVCSPFVRLVFLLPILAFEGNSLSMQKRIWGVSAGGCDFLTGLILTVAEQGVSPQISVKFSYNPLAEMGAKFYFEGQLP